MSTIIINNLTLKAVLDGTEVLEISEGGTGSFKTPVSGFSTIFQLLSLKDAANGYAGLDASSLLNVAQIPTAIPAINIADGTVDNTEFQRLNGITSALEEQGNKGAVSGYAGLDASQELLLANFPSGTGLQVLRRNTGNTALEFATLSDLQGITSINADTTAAQLIVGTTNVITVGTVAGTTTIDIDSAYVGQTSITTLGTITTGVWNGTAITGANINAASTDLTDTAVIARSTNNLSFFAATTSAQLAGVISDETGTGLLVFGTSPTIVTPTIANFTNATHDHTNASGGGQLLSTSALSDTSTIAYLNTTNVYTAGTRQDFLGLLAGTAGLNVGGIAGNPTTQVNGDVWYNSSTNTLFGRINGVDVDLGQSGSEVTTWTANHSMATFKLTATAVNDVILLAPTGQGVSIEVNSVQEYLFNATQANFLSNNVINMGTLNTHTIPGGTSTFTIISDNLSVFAATTSAQLASVISDETGSGLLVFGTSPTIVTPTIASFTNATHDHSNAAGGGNLTNSALTSGAFANITSIGTLAADIVMGGNDITGIQTTKFDQTTITYAATLDFDFDTDQYNQLTLTGVLSTLTTSNRAAGKMKTIVIIADSVDRVLTFNTSWKTNPSDATVTVTANTFGVLSLYSRGTAETDVFAVYAAFS